MTKIDSDFWHARWRAGEIGFHQDEVEPLLVAHFPKLSPTTVFVPLCGKSLDMTWLAAQGHRVVGVELSPLACEKFFEENRIPLERKEPRGAFTVYEGKGITIFCGDLFSITARELEGVTAVYDRAALIALPPETRARYAAHLCSLLASGSRMLLIVLTYAQSRVEGPPFSVEKHEIEKLYGPVFKIEQVHHEVVTEMAPKFDGVTVSQNAYLLTKR